MSSVRGASLQLNGLNKRYGSLRAVDNVSLDIAAGEFLTLLGPSGSGKTTLLKLIAGFLAPDAGSIVVAGRDITPLPPFRRNIGVVFQSYALFPHLTAAENIAFPLKMRHVAPAEISERVARALALVKLDGLGTRRPKELSGGQQQRVAMARALVFEPELLLMDEPMGALDRGLREALQIEVMSLTRRLGLTCVYVTHDQDEALIMSDRIAVVNGGKIEQVGTVEAIYERPATSFVARFVGESNLVAGTVASDAESRFLKTGEMCLEMPPGADFSDGASVSIMVRPERCRLSTHDEPGLAIRVPAEVDEVIYLGTSRKYHLVSSSGLRLVVRVPIANGISALRPGERAIVTWSPADSVAVPQ